MTIYEKMIKEISNILQLDFSKVKITVQYQPYTVKSLVEYLDSGIIRISQEMQRQYVWDDVRASQYIETLIYGLVSPPIILAEYGDALYVVDGVQRLTTIRKFYNNELRLVGVNPVLRNKRYETLTREQKKKFEMAMVPTMIVSVDGDPEMAGLIYIEMFRRINLGAKPMSLMQVLFYTIPTSNNLIIKDVARSEEFRRLFQPSENEVKEGRDLYISLALHMAFMRGEPLNLIGSFRQRYIRDIVNMLFRQDIVDTLRDISEKVKASIDLALRLGFDKTMFISSTYRGAQPKRPLVNPVLAQAILLALYEEAEKKVIDGKLILDLPVENPQEFKRNFIELVRSERLDGKDFKIIWTEIAKNGKTETLRRFYMQIRKIIRLLTA